LSSSTLLWEIVISDLFYASREFVMEVTDENYWFATGKVWAYVNVGDRSELDLVL
jgi:hypothetical protein